jgi:hypothetical protein
MDPEILAHLEWISFVRPTGLVVSAPALVRAGAILDRRDAEGQRLLRSCVQERTFDAKEGPVTYLTNFRMFAESVLGWSFSPKGYAGTAESSMPAELEAPLPDYGETLRPDFAVRELEPKDGASPWQLLVRVLDLGEDFDRVVRGHGGLEASAHGRMERLLRQTGVSAGLLFNGLSLRLLSAPRGESSGWVDFRVADMIQTAGRPISTALRLLLGQARLLSLPRTQRLAALLEDSRKFQNEVSERLAEQVLHALYELLRGFQAAHDASKGALLREPLAEHPDEVYRALLTVILRLVFLLYSEERDMLPEDETFLRYYSLAGLYERLREDAALFPDTMDQRYGAWAQLLVLFRMIYDGAESGAMRLPQRHGVLFDPERFKFLEGRPWGGPSQVGERIKAPLVPDGTIYRALEKLLVLDGERISYRALDVEQIGSVYETMMGFRLETAIGRSVAIKPQKKQGAPTAVDLEALLSEPASKREKWLQDHAERELTDRVKKAVAAAATVEDLHAGLLPVIDIAATPDLAPKGAMVLQPSEERRRSGSHYTPRTLTEPMVRMTIEPILARLRGEDGRPPRPAHILDLKVCDPAMGSGAFLVEVCRQLGDALVEAWHAHGQMPAIPPDEDEVIFARRLIAQRCLYGLDKNPVAVDLAKVSLWLVTLAKDHALTFVDHALLHGDSLVGLSRKQIEAFHWNPDAPRFQAGFETMRVREQVAKVAELRRRIREAGESVSDLELRGLWDDVQLELGKVRLFGGLVLAAFFESRKPRDREQKRAEYAHAVVRGDAERYRRRLEELRQQEQPLAPFHWEIEFPEVFERSNAGFDAIAGNPPFLGGTLIGGQLGLAYHDYLVSNYPPATGLADLIAFFLRRAFELLRRAGALGLIATNTVAQGDTRSTGLEQVLRQGGSIFQARRRYQWPGNAAVVVSLLHIEKIGKAARPLLDDVRVDRISAYLLAGHVDATPVALSENKGICYRGTKIWGSGFVFEGTPSNGSSSLTEMERLISHEPRNKDVIFAYLGGEDFNSSPTQRPSRFVIDFGNMSEDQARRWPALFSIVEERVRPVRANNKQRNYREHWWLHANRVEEAGPYLQKNGRLLALTCVSQHMALAFVPRGTIIQDRMILLLLHESADFAVIQSRVHEVWVRMVGTTLGDALSYTTTCFDTFPRPPHVAHARLQAAGARYYDFRAHLMECNDEGLTKTYNRFHNPDERDPDIIKLRELHAAMDRAVLDAYGWSDIQTAFEFLLDHEIDEEEWGNKKKPWRYRWPDEVRDEVLARLLELNAERAKEEVRAGAAAAKKSGKKAAAKRALGASDTEGLFS